jgi:hypothetical protein
MNKEWPMNELNDEDDREGGEPLTAEAFSALLYSEIATEKDFDAVGGLDRRTPTEFVVYPFDGPPLSVKVAPAQE